MRARRGGGGGEAAWAARAPARWGRGGQEGGGEFAGPRMLVSEEMDLWRPASQGPRLAPPYRRMFRVGLMSSMNSIRVDCRVRKTPRMAEGTALEFGFSPPRMIMQRWNASMTTATPWGCSVSMIAVAISWVRRPCTCRRGGDR